MYERIKNIITSTLLPKQIVADMSKFSVLMSIYFKERSDFLRASLDSILQQELLPEEIILMEDGLLTPELDRTIEEFEKRTPLLKVYKLKENHGLGYALNKGLLLCNYDIIARMDTDDICKPSRFKEEMAILEANPDIAVVGSWVDEFVDTPERVLTIRTVPEHPEEIAAFAKKRNPMNHPTVMFRKNEVLDAGNYISMLLFEDYYLWARMITQGKKLYNIQHSLLFFRRNAGLSSRRGGTVYIKKEFQFQKAIQRLGLINRTTMFSNCLIRFCIRLIPNCFRNFLYIKFLRNKA